jgi:chromosome segregation and condensation protein ScpB
LPARLNKADVIVSFLALLELVKQGIIRASQQKSSATSRLTNPKDERSVLYEPTTELLSHLGVTALADVPDFKEVQEKLKQLESSYHDAATQ